ncbi:sigma-70 family RNA polymerase sigma factor [Pseudonocardia lacus]|uniref:sigma-70 family RNA polymerase sigma factor n=1 Tax=Pseudonocardia lacus TaxID=2835865 RepID=UPI0027E265E1|nr:sigma-70 family RNA polymerase sigma factor [Pseudonocardia lacus]
MSSITAEADFAARTGPHRRELVAYCYRMLGSPQEAEDLAQETLLRAWKARERYDERRASVRTWLYRIATNACLSALRSRARRPLPSGLGAPSTDPEAPLVPVLDVPWLQPSPDAGAGMRLAFVAALQLLPARQRAVLVLRDVLEFSAAEVAAQLGASVAAVNSALQRARSAVAVRALAEEDLAEPDDPATRAAVDAYVRAFEAADVAALVELLTEDAVLEMPPVPLWYRGRQDYGRFIAHVFTRRGTGWRMRPARANGQPALVAHAPGPEGLRLHTLQVLDVSGGRIARNTVFADPAVLAAFALPATPPEGDHGR